MRAPSVRDPRAWRCSLVPARSTSLFGAWRIGDRKSGARPDKVPVMIAGGNPRISTAIMTGAFDSVGHPDFRSPMRPGSKQLVDLARTSE